MHNNFIRTSKFMFPIVMVAALLGGCSSMPKIVEFDPSARERIHKIALLEVVPSNNFILSSLTPRYVRSPVLDAIAQAQIEHENQIRVNYLSEMNKRGITLCPEMVDALQKNLQQKGYEVIYLESQRPQLTEDKKPVYSNISSDADAILNVSYQQIGFVSTPESLLTSLFTPTMSIEAELVDTHMKNILYHKIFVVSGSSMVKSLEIMYEAISPGKEYKFSSSDEVLNKFDLSIESLNKSQEKVAHRIANQLGKKNKTGKP
jgi:hypothetical protein